MVTVRIFKLQHLIRFMRAFHLLTTIGEERGNIEFYKSGLDFVVISRHLFVLLHIRHPFLHHYQPPNSSNYFTIHLKEFRQHLGHRALTSSSMDFNLDHHYPPLAALTFHDDNSGARFTRIINVSNSEHIGKLGGLTIKKFVSMDSEKFKLIVMEFMNIDKVNVVLTNSQVTFSSEFKEITINAEDQGCIISGVDDGERIQYSVRFQPTSFFCDLANLIEKVTFYHETTKRNIAMSAPIGFNSIFIINFLNIE
ncbi:hypothetical protein IC582_027099 [Cucumis melo]|uniref:Uncharacterized protein LOC103497734 n=1 Tax=Cucumis melo TaxID=3656 RepID=A0A1S3C827_CUCME|nr:uncharacterized protein LOC103497734 [Cucumis melo]